MTKKYYFDIETTGLNPATSKIITIQFQELDFEGKPIGSLTFLKEWESSEGEILKKFYEKLNYSNNVWDFVPCGYNLKFEHDFLLNRGKLYNLDFDLLSRPVIDLHPIGIMMNDGNHKGSGLDKISGKQGNGLYVVECYINKDYVGIEEYVIQETREYLKLYYWLKVKMPKLLMEFKNAD